MCGFGIKLCAFCFTFPMRNPLSLHYLGTYHETNKSDSYVNDRKTDPILCSIF